MSELSSQHCTCLAADDISMLEQEHADTLLLQLDPQWVLKSVEKTIHNTFKFKNYYQTMAFVNVIAQIAHQQDHHPDLLVCYNHCTVTYSTHSVGGLSIKDFICAAKINAAQNL